MTAFILYYAFAAIFLVTLVYIVLKEDRDPSDSKFQHYSALILLSLLVIIIAPILLPIGLAYTFNDHTTIMDEQLKELKEKKKTTL
jgi:NADH:ubiquinone oxidoreductase subunit 6 (subunit J)